MNVFMITPVNLFSADTPAAEGEKNGKSKKQEALGQRQDCLATRRNAEG